jgi:hypothetical protein
VEWLWIVLGVLYFVLMVTLGVMTLRGGHYWLFVFGLFLPVLWVVGGLIPPTESAALRHAAGHAG